jgi:hypothetical protein
MHYEYKVIPAPQRGDKVRGARTTEDRFAQTLTATMNAHARDGWEYVRSETLPSEERAGFTKRRTVYVNLLVFRRSVSEDETSTQRLALTATPAANDAPRLQVAPEGNAPRLGPATE